MVGSLAQLHRVSKSVFSLSQVSFFIAVTHFLTSIFAAPVFGAGEWNFELALEELLQLTKQYFHLIFVTAPTTPASTLAPRKKSGRSGRRR